MKRQMGFILWFILPILFLAMLVASPFLDSWAHWALIISGQAFLLWAAIKATFGKDIQHGIGIVLALLGMGIAGIIRRIGKWRNRKRRLKEIKAKRPKPVRIATRSIEIASAHSKISNRGLTIVVGYNSRKRPESIDLREYHTLIGSSTGGGKTNLINSMLIQLFNKRRAPEVYLVDLKGNREDALHVWGAVATYVDDVEPALELLRGLVVKMEERNRQPALAKRPVLLIIDEVADLTTGTEDRKYRQSAVRLLTLLARKARSANISMVVATQHPRYDILDKAIANNLMRKILLPVDTSQQAEVVFGFNPKSKLPGLPGEFMLKDGLKISRGRTLRVKREEIDTVLLKHIASFREKELQLWKIVGLGKDSGDTVAGIRKTFAAHPRFGQDFVKFGFRHLAYAGALTPPKRQGESSRMAVSFLDGIHLIKEYMKEGRWTGEPRPFVRMK